MIVAFASLFLGLTLGVQPVTVTVTDRVAGVEILLDGRQVGVAEAPSWTVPVDFGSILAPHELEAVALDAAGTELARTSQRVNLPRPAAEAEVVIEGGGDGGGRDAVARVTWDSVAATTPRSVHATLDGRSLAVSDPHRIPLPPFDPDQLHFLRVELDFSDTVSAVAEATFGGVYLNDTRTELTALPVVPQKGAPKRLAGGGPRGLVRDGRRRAVEAGGRGDRSGGGGVRPRRGRPARDLEAGLDDQPARLERQHGRHRSARRAPERCPGDGAHRRRAAGPVVAPVRDAARQGPAPAPALAGAGAGRRRREPAAVELFPRSEDHPPGDGGVLWLLSEAHQPASPWPTSGWSTRSRSPA